MSKRRPVRTLLLALVALATAAVVVVPAGGPSGAADDNPWLHRRVLSIAHAGGENEAPHETLFAYKRAHALGTDVLELDVRLTGDGVLVVHHDADVDATTNGTGLVIDKTYAELFALDHGYKFTPQRWSCGDCPVEDYVYRGVRTGDKAPPAGYVADDFTIPTVETLFDTFPDAYFDIEIKEQGEPARAAARALAEQIEAHDLEQQVVVVSFDQAIVEYVRTLLPDVDTSPGVAGVQQFFFDRKPQPDHEILQVPPTYDLDGTIVTVVSEQFVEDAHDAGLAVWVWMNGREQENAEFYRELIAMGVDGILGAAPAVARQVIDESGLAWDGTDPVPTTSVPTTSTTTTTSTPPGTTSAAPAATPVAGQAAYTG
jgi:glycerophosphoryl diester phosphodiesterase